MRSDDLEQYKRLSREVKALLDGAPFEENTSEQLVLYKLAATLQQLAVKALNSGLKEQEAWIKNIQSQMHAANGNDAPDEE